MARKIIQHVLRFFAKRALRRYRPLIIAVTGSAGKTSTKEAIFTVLRSQYHDRVRRTILNLNTEIGVPLTILGLRPAGRNPILWMIRCLEAFLISCVVKVKSYPEVIVVEMGADRPGDIRYLVELAPPTIGVVTAVGEIPVHVEYFAGPKSLAREKARLVEALPQDGWAILNFDDLTVLEMRERTQARVLTYGFGEGAAVRATTYELRTRVEDEREVPDGVSFKLEYQGNIIPVRLSGAFGKSVVYAALAAAAVGIAMKMNLVEISEALGDYLPPPHRLCYVPGVKRTSLLDDTYNASPLSMHAALDIVEELPAKRKILVLGDMLELGKYAEAAHRTVGERVARIADIFVTVGERMRFAAHEAIDRGMDTSRIRMFSTAGEAGRYVQEILEPGDLVLVKGSRAMRMEKIIEELRAA
jgi:UDP-N-acetylmuramoyl-tripeptide--D-alanyl-D-alanine ligase